MYLNAKYRTSTNSKSKQMLRIYVKHDKSLGGSDTVVRKTEVADEENS